jgi:hypothetical protein
MPRCSQRPGYVSALQPVARQGLVFLLLPMRAVACGGRLWGAPGAHVEDAVADRKVLARKGAVREERLLDQQPRLLLGTANTDRRQRHGAREKNSPLRTKRPNTSALVDALADPTAGTLQEPRDAELSTLYKRNRHNSPQMDMRPRVTAR